MDIRKFYQNKRIFITGASGFIGKVLLEKLLYSFPQIDLIYIIIRPKNKMSAQQRFLKEVLDSRCFDRLRQIHKEQFEQFMKSKVVALEGDVEKPYLGLRKEDYNRVAENCQIFFANAANIKFDSNLDQQIKANIDATLMSLQLAKQANAQIFIQTSTFAVNNNQPNGYVTQQLHDIIDIQGNVPDYELLYQQLKTMKNQEIRAKASSILKNYKYPNQYTFSKSLSEHLVQSRRGITPVAIIRPTMVYSTYSQPFPGWIDVLHAGQIIFLFTGFGIMQQFLMDPYLQVDTVPADIVVHNMIGAAAFEAGQNKLSVYHVSSVERNPILWKEMISITVQFWRAYPTPKQIATPKALVTNNQLRIRLHYFYRQFWIWMTIKLGPFFYPDKKQQFARLQRLNQKVKKVTKLYEYGFDNFWVYETKRVDKLKNWLGGESGLCVDCADINMLSYFLRNNYGIKKYILKEEVEGVPELILTSDRIELDPKCQMKPKL